MKAPRWLHLTCLLALPLAEAAAPASGATQAVVEARFTIDRVEASVNGRPSDHSFDGLVGLPITLRMEFASITSESHKISGDGTRLVVLTGPLDVSVTGDPTGYLTAHVAPNLQGGAIQIYLDHDPNTGQTTLNEMLVFRGTTAGRNRSTPSSVTASCRCRSTSTIIRCSATSPRQDPSPSCAVSSPAPSPTRPPVRQA